MRIASMAPLALIVTAAFSCAVACSGDDDDSSANNPSAGAPSSQGGEPSASGGSGTSGTSGQATAGASGGPADSQLCADLGGPAGIDAVVRGDGKASKSDAFNGFKFEHGGERQASVLLNVATDPCIGQQFASLLTPERADDLEHLAECLSLYVQNTAGCAVAYDHDQNGKVCKSMVAAHAGLDITDEDYTALITDAANALIAAGVEPASDQFKAVATALTAPSLKADIITSQATEYSQPGAMCLPGAGGAAGAGGMSGMSGMGGMGGAP